MSGQPTIATESHPEPRTAYQVAMQLNLESTDREIRFVCQEYIFLCRQVNALSEEMQADRRKVVEQKASDTARHQELE